MITAFCHLEMLIMANILEILRYKDYSQVVTLCLLVQFLTNKQSNKIDFDDGHIIICYHCTDDYRHAGLHRGGGKG